MTNIPGFKGQLSTNIVQRGEMADDFGHAIHKLPTLRATPLDADDLSILLKWAAVQKPPLRCAARGIGHSAFGQSQIYNGIAIDTSRLTHAHIASDKKSITVGCGAAWQVVIDAAAKEQLRVPITTANPFLTVGGSMSLAAMDYTSSTFGAAVDHVLELKVVTGTGEIVICSEQENKDLFDAVRCGFGEYGIMVEATFPLLPIPESVLSYWLVYDDFDQAYQDMQASHDNPLIQGSLLEVIPRQSSWYLGIDYAIQFQVRTEKCLFPFVPSIRGCFMYLLTLIIYVEPGKEIAEKDILRNLKPQGNLFGRFVWNNRKERQSYEDWKKFLDPALALAQKQKLITQPNVVLSIFLEDEDSSKSALKEVVEYIRPNDIRPLITNFAISIYDRKAFRSPGFVAPTNSENFIMFNIIHATKKVTADKSRFENTLEVYQESDDIWKLVDQTVQPKDGRLTGYAWGYQPITWREYYGPYFDRQLAWKKRFDPQNLLGGCNMFEQYL